MSVSREQLTSATTVSSLKEINTNILLLFPDGNPEQMLKFSLKLSRVGFLTVLIALPVAHPKY